ncbi:MAG TPA: class I SAM-dependent methyltransferase [Thermoanaerobaculia bacterium]|nr:class I SAM-dependent methyltransferase [Thermoanaerobaculia bacterium]
MTLGSLPASAPTRPSAEAGPLVRALLAAHGLAPEDVDLAVHPDDEMLGFLVACAEGDRDQALAVYAGSGLSIAAAFRQLLAGHFGGLDRVGLLLDFASGYGRVTRFLVRDLPPERLWVADVYAGGVRFQEERFGVHGFVSAARPEELRCDRRFDAILVTSLFTHLPEERFVAWLARLHALLAPGGLLAFSVHDESVLAPGVEMPEGGLRFEAISESGSLAPSEYGSTWVSERFVRAAAVRAAGDVPVRRVRRGLCDFQDLYLLTTVGGPDPARLPFDPDPRSYVEQCAVERGRLTLRGWAVRLEGEPLARAEVLLGGELLGAAPIDRERPDVAALTGEPAALRSGWLFEAQLPAGTPRSAPLVLRLADRRGGRTVVHVGTLASALLHSARQETVFFQTELRRAEAEAARAAAELRARIAAMEASRFWQLRNRWFAVKRFLGLTREQ